MVEPVLPIGTTVINSFITLVITVPLSALALFLSGKIWKVKLEFGKCLVAALIIGVIRFVVEILGQFTSNVMIIVLAVLNYMVSIALYLTLPQLFWKFEWKNSLLIGAVWFGFMLVVGAVLGIIVTGIAAALMYNMIAVTM